MDKMGQFLTNSNDKHIFHNAFIGLKSDFKCAKLYQPHRNFKPTPALTLGCVWFSCKCRGRASDGD